jgi:hypothetical protein
MIIIGHPLVRFKPLYKVTSIEKAKTNTAENILLVDFNDVKLVQYCISQEFSLALHVKSIKDACLANAIGAKYILVDKAISKDVQNIATEYLFDAKIILRIKNESEIEEAARELIDGVIFKKGVV